LILLHPVSSRYLLWSRFILVALTSSRLISVRLASSHLSPYLSLSLSRSFCLGWCLFTPFRLISSHLISFA
jgi:hypothetical protein